MRIVSLLPSATEMLCLIGGQGWLVGRSHECDHPTGIDHLPVLTRAATSGVSSAAIDADVRDRLTSGESLYHLDVPLLRALRPDVILTQDLCRVCSIDLAVVRAAAAALEKPPDVVSLNAATVEGVLDDLLTVGAACGLHDRATAAVVAMRERMFAAQDHVNPYDDGPSLAFLEWADPLFVAGHWTAQMVERAGARHPLNPTRIAREDAGSASGPQQAYRVAGPSIRVSIDQLVASEPEFIVVCPCGLGLDRAMEETARLAESPWWRALPAVQRGRVAVVDGNQMFNRPGPRLAEAFEWLAGWVQGVPRLIPTRFPWAAIASQA